MTTHSIAIIGSKQYLNIDDVLSVDMMYTMTNIVTSKLMVLPIKHQHIIPYKINRAIEPLHTPRFAIHINILSF